MERLLVARENTDGFTFSVTQHIPVVFSSKEEFLITLEDKIKDALKFLKEHQEKYNASSEKLAKKVEKFQSQKNLTEKETKAVYSEVQKMMAENNALAEKIKDIQNLKIGGQDFELGDFVSRSYDYDGSDPTEYINLPHVFTVDEYFSDVEKALAPNKPKM